MTSDEANVLNWLQRGGPWADSLVATTVLVLSALAADRGIGATAVEEIRSSAQDLHQWLEDDTCPDANLADRYEVFIARYRFICLEISSDRKRLPANHVEVMIDRLGAVNAEFEKFLVDLQ